MSVLGMTVCECTTGDNCNEYPNIKPEPPTSAFQCYSCFGNCISPETLLDCGGMFDSTSCYLTKDESGRGTMFTIVLYG